MRPAPTVRRKVAYIARRVWARKSDGTDVQPIAWVDGRGYFLPKAGEPCVRAVTVGRVEVSR